MGTQMSTGQAVFWYFVLTVLNVGLAIYFYASGAGSPIMHMLLGAFFALMTGGYLSDWSHEARRGPNVSAVKARERRPQRG